MWAQCTGKVLNNRSYRHTLVRGRRLFELAYSTAKVHFNSLVICVALLPQFSVWYIQDFAKKPIYCHISYHWFIKLHCFVQSCTRITAKNAIFRNLIHFAFRIGPHRTAHILQVVCNGIVCLLFAMELIEEIQRDSTYCELIDWIDFRTVHIRERIKGCALCNVHRMYFGLFGSNRCE